MFNLVPEIQEKNRRGNIAGGGGEGWAFPLLIKNSGLQIQEIWWIPR